MGWIEGTGIRLLCGISGAFGADNWLTTLRERCTNCSNWNIFHIHGKGKAKIRIQIVYFHVEAQGETARGAVQGLRSGEGRGLGVGGWQHLHKLRRLNLGKTNQASVEPAPN